MLRIDFHYHGLLSTAAPLDREALLYSLGYARRTGLDAICLCEHSRALAFDDLHHFLGNSYLYDGNAYHFRDMLVFTGIEVNIAPKGHIVVLAPLQDVRKLRHALLRQYPSSDPSLQELVALIGTMAQREEFFVIGGHPARKGQELYSLSGEELALLDAVDLNGKDIDCWRDICRWLTGKNTPAVTGSDTHYPTSCGNAYTVVEMEKNTHVTLGDLKCAVLEGRYQLRTSPWYRWKNRNSARMKKELSRKTGLANPRKNRRLSFESLLSECQKSTRFAVQAGIAFSF